MNHLNGRPSSCGTYPTSLRLQIQPLGLPAGGGMSRCRYEAFAASEAGNEQGGAERRDENQAGERQPDAIGRRAPRRQPGSFIDGTLGRPVQGFQATAAGARLV